MDEDEWWEEIDWKSDYKLPDHSATGRIVDTKICRLLHSTSSGTLIERQSIGTVPLLPLFYLAQPCGGWCEGQFLIETQVILVLQMCIIGCPHFFLEFCNFFWTRAAKWCINTNTCPKYRIWRIWHVIERQVGCPRKDLTKCSSYALTLCQ